MFNAKRNTFKGKQSFPFLAHLHKNLLSPDNSIGIGVDVVVTLKSFTTKFFICYGQGAGRRAILYAKSCEFCHPFQ